MPKVELMRDETHHHFIIISIPFYEIPHGCLKDVPIKMGGLYVPDRKSPIIFGRPFLAIVRCCINVKNGVLFSDVVKIIWSSICLRLRNSLLLLMSAIELM